MFWNAVGCLHDVALLIILILGYSQVNLHQNRPQTGKQLQEIVLQRFLVLLDAENIQKVHQNSPIRKLKNLGVKKGEFLENR